MPEFFMFGPPPSEEEQEEMKKAQETQELQVRDFQHGFTRMVDELDRDNLQTLNTMLHIMVNNTGHPLPAQWQGVVRHALHVRFGVCMFCGINHEEEMQKDMEAMQGGTMPVMPPDSGVEIIEGHQPPAESVGDEPIPETITPETWTLEERKLIEEYHLDDVYAYPEEGDKPPIFQHFACTGIKGSRGPCGVTYPSLADRMLKGPEQCSGCFQRNAHG